MSREMKDSGVSWVGVIPYLWIVRRLRYLGSLASSGVDKKTYEGESTYKSVQYMNVYKNSLKEIGNSEVYLLVSADGNQAKNCTLQDGDVLFTNSSETPEDIGHSVVISEDLDNTLFGYHLMRFRPNGEVSGHFAKYMFGSHYVRKWFSYRAYGMTRYGISRSDFSDAIMILPPLNEQHLITNYLDMKCLRIDRLIALQGKMITELHAYKQSVITEAVTKGLDSDVPMKDSGVEWLGVIPMEWNAKRLKYGVKIRNTRANNPQLQYIGLENVESLSGKLIVTDSQYDAEQALLVKQNDVLFGKLRPYLAKVHLAANDAVCSGEFAIFYDFDYSQEFLRYQMLSHWFTSIVNSSTYGAKMPRANIDFIRELVMLFPSEQEQDSIVEYLNDVCKKIDYMLSLKQSKIEALKEFKKSLIYECVTGKRDCTTGRQEDGT